MLEAVGIGRKAGDRWLLQDISLAIEPGQRLALAGPSGSGKTLLLRSLAMLDPIDAGEIHWHGETVQANDVPKFRSRVIYLAQRPALLEGTVEDNLRRPFSLRAHHDKQFDRNRTIARLESLGRNDAFLFKQQRDLSGGEAQLTALLRALQLEPHVLLLDEPTAALDADATEMVENLVAAWLDERLNQRASVWVTHNRQQAQRVGDRIAQIANGILSDAH